MIVKPIYSSLRSEFNILNIYGMFNHVPMFICKVFIFTIFEQTSIIFLVGTMSFKQNCDNEPLNQINIKNNYLKLKN